MLYGAGGSAADLEKLGLETIELFNASSFWHPSLGLCICTRITNGGFAFCLRLSCTVSSGRADTGLVLISVVDKLTKRQSSGITPAGITFLATGCLKTTSTAFCTISCIWDLDIPAR